MLGVPGLIFLAGLTAGFFVQRAFSKKYEIVRVCSEEHRVGSISLKHHPRVTCQMALWIARQAQDLWNKLAADFPEETREELVLEVIFDPRTTPGWKVRNEPRVVINPVYFFLGKPTPAFAAKEQAIRGLLAEELHHLVRSRRFGEESYFFLTDPEKGPVGGVGGVAYYGINEFEYEALNFCVRATGDRADLLAEVEDYRRKTGRGV